MRSQIISNILKILKPKKRAYTYLMYKNQHNFEFTCYLCPHKPILKNLKHLKFHNRKYHKGKVGIVYNRDDKK